MYSCGRSGAEVADAQAHEVMPLGMKGTVAQAQGRE